MCVFSVGKTKLNIILVFVHVVELASSTSLLPAGTLQSMSMQGKGHVSDRASLNRLVESSGSLVGCGPKVDCKPILGHSKNKTINKQPNTKKATLK